jgi:hypothetical protein
MYYFSNSINFIENVFDSNTSPNGGSIYLGSCNDGENADQ